MSDLADLTLPEIPIEQPQDTVCSSPEQEFYKCKILLVDDQPENLIALEAVLQTLGQELVKADSGRDALRHLLDQDFAVIVLDVKMPDMDGFETASLIRARPRSRHTPIIFLTGLRNEELLFKGYTLGAVDYLFKPVVPAVLRAKVSAFVELSQKTELLAHHAELLEAKNAALEHSIEERRVAQEQLRVANTELTRLNERLRQEIAKVEFQARELQRSNAELERFAYVASHDLQEPLRTVASYTQLLSKRYKGKLDSDADEFIGYVIDGVSRMRSLIEDLLAYSRVNAVSQKLQDVDLEDALSRASSTLRGAIQESGAVVTHDPLPTVHADPTQIRQLFQNLIGNAIKFRSERAPQIHVSARLLGNEWLCSVRDNGIGLEMEYRDRIFVVFQRLHSREKYPGTGIGLAICKKIVETHGGRIWVESTPGEGSTFCFTLPTEATHVSMA